MTRLWSPSEVCYWHTNSNIPISPGTAIRLQTGNGSPCLYSCPSSGLAWRPTIQVVVNFLTRSAHAIGRHEDQNCLFSVSVTIQHDFASVVLYWCATWTRSGEPAFVVQKGTCRRQTPSEAPLANNSFCGASVVSNRCNPGPRFAMGAVFSFSVGFADARRDNQDRQGENCKRCGDFPNHVRTEFSCSLDLLQRKREIKKNGKNG